MTAALLGSLAFLRGLKPWHIIAASIAAWSGIVGVKAYRAGGAAVYAKEEKKAKKAGASSAKAHDTARAPGAADRLMKESCRNC